MKKGKTFSCDHHITKRRNVNESLEVEEIIKFEVFKTGLAAVKQKVIAK